MLNESGKRIKSSLNAKYTINAQCKTYVNCPKKALKGKIHKAKGDSPN
jgi:hypothetical protein